MADSFMQIDSEGATGDKDTFIQGVVSEDLIINPYNVDDFKIRVYGNTALLTGTTEMHGIFKARPFKTHYRSPTYT